MHKNIDIKAREKSLATYRRDFICCECGAMVRGPGGDNTDIGIGLKICCSKPMKQLLYEEAYAARRLSKEQRLKWYEAGCHFVKRGGKRKWAATMRQSRCYRCGLR